MEFLLPYVSGLCHPLKTIINLETDVTYAIGNALRKGNIWEWEWETLAVLLALLAQEQKSHFMDIGANIGFYSLASKALFGDHVECLAIEPTPKLVRKMRELSETNSLPISIMEVALTGSGKETATFYLRQDDSNSSTLYSSNVKDQITVAAKSLHAIYGSTTIIKIDTEGTECEILEDAIELLAAKMPMILIEILSDTEFKKLNTLFSQIGYYLYHLKKDFSITPVSNYPGLSREYNYLLTPNPVNEAFLAIHGQWAEAIKKTSHFKFSIRDEALAATDRRGLDYLRYKFLDWTNFHFLPQTTHYWLAFQPRDLDQRIHYEFLIVRGAGEMQICLHFELPDQNANVQMRNTLLQRCFAQRVFLGNKIEILNGKNIKGIYFKLAYNPDYPSLDNYSNLMKCFINHTLDRLLETVKPKG